ncbi:MAG: wax ester/triacylglycerol synthase domain-containing protein [Acidimicrobiia bacterium]
MMELATDVGPVPRQVGAILVFAPGAGPTAGDVREALAERTRGVPRLRQELVRTPPGCGRPVWVDAPDVDVARHVREVRGPPPGDEAALLRVATGAVTRPLPSDRPLWSATLVTGLAGNARALIVVFHHVLADGMGGLAVLANLVDGVPVPTPSDDVARSRPSWPRLARDAASGRLRALAHLPGVPARLRDAVAEMRPGAVPRAPRCSLNRPVGPRRRLGLVRADLARVRAAGREHGATVNDVVLAAVAGALGSLLARRGESVGHVVASVPVSGRGGATSAELGNQVGVIPVALPLAGGRSERLRSIAAATRAHRTEARGASAVLIAPLFRGLAALGVVRWFMERQRLVTTFVTNLRGPDAPVSFLGSAVSEVVPLALVAGNVAVSFAVLSYAGTLTVTVIVDEDAFPDADVLVGALQSELDGLAPGPGT